MKDNAISCTLGRDFREKGLSILLTTNHLLGWTGSETLVSTLTEILSERGCQLIIYARHINWEWVRQHGDPRVHMVDDLEQVRDHHFDLAHVHHSSCLVDVKAAFPTLPVVFSSLGVLPFLEQPAPIELGVHFFLAVSEEVATSLHAHGVPRDRIQVLRNVVNEKRFLPATLVRPRPGRILVLSYKMRESQRNLLRAAAERLGASIRFLGDVTGVVPQDELPSAINSADVVVSLGRGVIEAMLCGRVPLVFDINGLDGLVTPDNFDELKTHNFSGRRYARTATVDELIAELSHYRAHFGAELRDMAVKEFGTVQYATKLFHLYNTLLTQEPLPLPDAPTLKFLRFSSALGREDTTAARAWLASMYQARNGQLAAQSEVLRIKGTVSWRITAPLRVCWNLFGLLLRTGPKIRRWVGRT